MIKNNFSEKVFFAFTLAEVLITLGIIGIVAAMTIPTLVKNYQKQQTVEKFKKGYVALSQAIKLSEIDNGPASDWHDIGYGGSVSTKDNFMKKYITLYMRILKDYDNGTVILSDGIEISGSPQAPSGSPPEVNFIIDINGKNTPNKYGKDQYVLRLEAGFLGGQRARASWMTRARAISGYSSYADYGCQYKNPTVNNNTFCSNLIMIDGWKISDDYPW